jgi:hypothetical protein
MTKLEGILIGVIVLMLAFGGFYLYGHHTGTVQCVQANETTAAAAEVKNAHIEAAGTIAAAAEDTAREKALAAPLAPTPTVPVGVQLPAVAARSCPVPKAGTAPSQGVPADDLRRADAPGVVQSAWDPFIGADVQRARDADIEVADRDALLRNLQTVCGGSPTR